MPVIGVPCGNFNVLVAYFDTPNNTKLLQKNNFITEEQRRKFSNNLEIGLSELFETYTKENIFSSLGEFIPKDVSIDFKIRVLNKNNNEELVKINYNNDDIETTYDSTISDFDNYDVILFIQDLNGIAGLGVSRWPLKHPTFNQDFPIIFLLDPEWISPGLFYNEMFRRNVPVRLAEYEWGKELIVNEGGTIYDRTPILNPRTMKDVKEQMQLLSIVLNGWYDIDEDGISDCLDPEIMATPDNVDADLIPDSLDPDLNVDNSPFFWKHR